MKGRRIALVASLFVYMAAFEAAGAPLGAGADADEARAYSARATGSFALGHYAQAADNFEKAFELRPEPALLYNAAQAHRLAGNKERALTLYQNYLRVYAKAGKRAEVESRIDELKKAIEHDRRVATAPPNNTEPISGGPLLEAPPPSEPAIAGPAIAPPPAAAPEAVAPVLLTQPAATPAGVAAPADTGPEATVQSRPLTGKPLFWVAVGGAVAAAVTIGLLLALGGAKDPSPSIGVVR
jgi:tetratricopeptide (TPR) repeat protein